MSGSGCQASVPHCDRVKCGNDAPRGIVARRRLRDDAQRSAIRASGRRCHQRSPHPLPWLLRFFDRFQEVRLGKPPTSDPAAERSFAIGFVTVGKGPYTTKWPEMLQRQSAEHCIFRRPFEAQSTSGRSSWRAAAIGCLRGLPDNLSAYVVIRRPSTFHLD